MRDKYALVVCFQASHDATTYLPKHPPLLFYPRFIEPSLELVELELSDVPRNRISKQFPAFEGLCRE